MTAIMHILDSVLRFIQTGCTAGKAIKTVFQWINDYNGALMVLTTLIYVVATIFISSSNKKSADASREQIAESQKQQKQNVGLQLYDKRKEVIKKISQKEYNEVYWDVHLLFTEELHSEFQKVALKSAKIKELLESVDMFELGLDGIIENRAARNIVMLRNRAVSDEDMGQLKETVIQEVKNKNVNADYIKYIDKYISEVAQAKELERQRGAESALLLLKLNEFVKDSIQ